MSNDNEFARLFKLQATANKLVLDGKREAKELSALLQGFIQKPTAEAATQMFDSAKYFVTCEGLYVCSDFKQRVLPAYSKLIAKRGLEGVDSVNLLRNMYDREIVAEYLGGEEKVHKHAFTPDQLSDLIDAQKGGVAGVLLNNGYANILYMVGVGGVLIPVSVVWNSDDSDWDVRACEFDDGYWGAVHRLLRNKN